MANEREAASRAGDPADAVAAYKELLRTLIDRRPSGTRQKLALALGTHKSFVSQITNPTYRVPLPAQHIGKIFDICHFSPEERRHFLQAYARAHPTQVPTGEPSGPSESLVLSIEVPALGDPARQRQLANAIRDVAERLIALAKGGD